MDNHKVKFYELLEVKLSELKGEEKRDNYCITTNKYHQIISTLQLPYKVASEYGAKWKQWCFKHFDVVQVGASPTLYSRKTRKPVVVKEEVFDAIKRWDKSNLIDLNVQDHSKFQLVSHYHMRRKKHLINFLF